MAKRATRVAAKPQGPSKEQKVAAATAVVKEILELRDNAEGELELKASIQVPRRTVSIGLVRDDEDHDREYRRKEVTFGQTLAWKGEVRAGATGNVLFIFEPIAPISHNGVGVEIVEIPHVELGEALGGFVDELTELLGAPVEEMLEQAMMVVTKQEAEAAVAAVAAQEPGDAQQMEDFGVW